MGAVVNLKQARGIDAGIDLRRREAGMAEQLLDGAQVAAPRHEVRCKAVPQRVRRRRLGQAEQAAQLAHPALHQAWVERAAAHAAQRGRSSCRRTDAVNA